MISLSEIIPSARITMNNGTGFLTLGIDTTICLLEEEGCSATILTDNVLIGFEASSETDRIFAE